MKEAIYQTSLTPEVILSCNGRLTINGWDQAQVQVEPGFAAKHGKTPEAFEVEQSDDLVRIQCVDALQVRVPHGTKLRIENAYAETVINGVHGAVVIEQCYGRLLLKDIGPLIVEQAMGGLTAFQSAGDVQVEKAFGPVTIEGVAGDFSASEINSNLTLSQVNGSMHATAKGNANLSITPAAGSEHQATVYGNLFLRVPADLNARLSLESYGPTVIKVGEVSRKITAGKLELTFGEGAALLNLLAYGSLTILAEGVLGGIDMPEDASAEDLEEVNMFGIHVEDIARQVNEQLQAQLEMLDVQMEQISNMTSHLHGLSPEKTEKIHQRMQEKAERAREKIQRAAERAQAKMERKMEAAQRRAERGEGRAAFEGKFGGFNFEFGRRSSARTAPQRDLEAEKMVILQMLAAKKITAEEADKLLSALEG